MVSVALHEFFDISNSQRGRHDPDHVITIVKVNIPFQDPGMAIEWMLDLQ
jgi:hypothetical protein